jgi:phospholipase D-like protein
LIVAVFTLVDLFRRNLDRRHTIAWLLIVVLVPLAGSVLYWVLRRQEAGAGAGQS